MATQIPARLDDDLLERVRDVCWWERMSVQEFFNAASAAYIEKLEQERGKKFEPRKGEVPKGRRG